MANGQTNDSVIAPFPVTRSRRENRRTLKGCVTRLEAIQGDIRKVGMQYADVNTTVFVALTGQHDILDMVKETLDRAGNAL